MLTAVGLRMSRVVVIEVTERVHSLTEPSIIECECASMMPGRTNFPVASMTRAPSGALRFCPTAAIFPPRRSTSVALRVPCETVSTVALRISVSCAADAAAGSTDVRV
jgi:hypothetical protein